jgi:hypothetical protein
MQTPARKSRSGSSTSSKPTINTTKFKRITKKKPTAILAKSLAAKARNQTWSQFFGINVVPCRETDYS